jgi:hypothetical protein
MEQLLLFAEPQEEILKRQVRDLREQCERVRKGQYAKITALTRQVDDLNHEVEFLKKAFCQSNQGSFLDYNSIQRST